MTSRNHHIGSLFEDFFVEEGILDECTTTAIKRVIARQIEQAMRQKGITKAGKGVINKVSPAKTGWRITTMSQQIEFIESTAGEIAAELLRRGVAPGQRVTIAIEPEAPDDWIAKARRFARPKVAAEGWSDTDIDRLIKEERNAVQPLIK